MKIFMKNKITKEKILIITTILVVSIVFIGIGYAFFTANNPEGSTAQIISKSGRMLLNYNDGTDNIVPITNIQPSNNVLVDKTFSLTGIITTSGKGINMPYVVSIEYQSTFQNENGPEFIYLIRRVDTNENISCTLKGIIENFPLENFGINDNGNKYTVGYFDDWSGETYKQELAKGEFKAVNGEQVITFNLKMMFLDIGSNQDYNKGATFNGKIVVTAPEKSTFATDSWATIASNIQSGNARYKVGEEKEVEMDIDDDGIAESYTVRLANNSTPSECSTKGFSQTACGFVVEFVDIVEQKAMNSTSTNVGGWPATEMITYINGEFLAKLPSDLQSVIADTTVVSGHGSSDSTNFISTDKIYLLSPREVWEDGSINAVSSYDTAYNSTRQLDYYANNNVTTSNYRGAIKNYAESAYWWWLRAVYSSFTNTFLAVSSDGGWTYSGSQNTGVGLAPAFRIG